MFSFMFFSTHSEQDGRVSYNISSESRSDGVHAVDLMPLVLIVDSIAY